MNSVEIFDFEEQAVRAVIGPDGEWWFVGKDVCDAMGHTNHRAALHRLDDDEKGVAVVYTLGGEQQMSIISEPGCYRLVFTSRTEKAEAFKRWLAHDVLPVLRRTGRFEMPATSTPETNDSPTLLIAGLEMEVVRGWLNIIREGRSLHGRSFGQALWARSPLPQPDGGTSPVAAFAEDMVYVAPGCVVAARTMYTAYTAWCASRDLRPLSEKAFAQAMVAAGFEKDRGRVRTYLAVALRGPETNG